jgi:alpha-N-arabinofuranosidase
MKKTLLLWLIVVPIALPAQTVKIKIDIDRTIGEIDPKIYGVFMEPIEFNLKRFGSDDTITHNTLLTNNNNISQ